MAVMSRRTRHVPLPAIIRDSRVQPREAINLTVVSEYAQAMAKAPAYREAGLPVEPFPAVIVYHEQDGDHDLFWLADGWHRVLAAEEAGLTRIEAICHPGGMLDAILHAAGANGKHGLKRTNRDKHRAVRMLLDHPTAIREEWGDARIAYAADVSQLLVRTVRRERETDLGLPPSTERRGRDGKLYSLQLRTERPQNGTDGTVPTPAPASPPEPTSGEVEAFLYQCGTADCKAVTTQPCWHCENCGAHLPVSEYPVGVACPVCVDDPLAVPLDVLARVEDRELPKAHTNGTTQVPYTPGRLKPASALLAYERLSAALDIIESLTGTDPRQVIEQAADPNIFEQRLRNAATELQVFAFLGGPVEAQR